MLRNEFPATTDFEFSSQQHGVKQLSAKSIPICYYVSKASSAKTKASPSARSTKHVNILIATDNLFKNNNPSKPTK